MSTPSRPRRRASMAKGGPVMLSWFSATENIDQVEEKGPKEQKKTTKSNKATKEAKLETTPVQTVTATTKTPPKPTQPEPPANEIEKPSPQKEPLAESPKASPQSSKTPETQDNMVDQLEVEITGLELLRRDDSWDTDSFSYESYARDSYAMAAKGSQHHTTVIRSGLVHRSPSIDHSVVCRRMSNCSSIGVDLDTGTYTHSYRNRRLSSESSTTLGSEMWASQSSPQQVFGRRNSSSPRHQPHLRPSERRASMESGYSSFAGASFANDSMEGRRRNNNGNSITPRSHRKLSRRSSTGTNDLPGFGAYKQARRKSSMGHTASYTGDTATNSTTGSAAIQNTNDGTAKPYASVQRAHSLGAGNPTSSPTARGNGGGRRDSMGESRRSSIGSRRSSIASRRSSLGSDKDALRNSSHGRRMSVGSSCNSGGGRPRI